MLASKGEVLRAQNLYQAALSDFPNNRELKEALKDLGNEKEQKIGEFVPTETVNNLVSRFQLEEFEALIIEANSLLNEYETDFVVWNLLGAALAQIGKMADATLAFKKVVELNPNFADGHNNLGNIFYGDGNYREAVVFFEKAVALEPNFPSAFINLGHAQKESGRLDEAIAAYNEAARLEPENVVILNHLGLVLIEKKNFSEAVRVLTRAKRVNRLYLDSHINLGTALLGAEKIQEAIASCRSALEIQPNSAEAFLGLGICAREVKDFSEALKAFNEALRINPRFVEALSNRGVVLAETEDVAGAMRSYKEALRFAPNHLDARFNLGISQRMLGLELEAIDSFDLVIAQDPTYVAAYLEKAKIFSHQAKFVDAMVCFELALKSRPEYALAYVNMGVLLTDQREYIEAAKAYEKALAIEPGDPEAKSNLGINYLTRGKFAEGFALYEWRETHSESSLSSLDIKKPRWRGERGSSVLLLSEQGIGDIILFASIIREICEVSEQVFFHCDARLVALFRRSFPSNLVLREPGQTFAENEIQYHLPIGSLPLYFRPNIESFKNGSGSYLLADQTQAEALRVRLKSGDHRAVVGVSWRGGSKKNPRSRLRHIELAELAAVFDKKKYKLVSLQYGSVEQELRDLDQDNTQIQSLPEIDNFNDLDGFASLIAACDHVVSVDNLTVHFSAALGVDTAVILPFSSGWRWGEGPRKSYWHEVVTLYRQEVVGSWEEPLNQLREIFG